MADGGNEWWASEPEKELYKKAVRACLDDPRLSELPTQRPTVTVEAVVEAMCSPPYAERAPARLSLRGIRENKDFRPWCAGLLVPDLAVRQPVPGIHHQGGS
ncbi:hypothetical protein ABT063_08950 [Streptomyces sp. NPDC002838]|uniref:hypothetical protein n=1 Tax=Streptomyces sp. NPDC002838 TaxID=3154436 RepID=UPI003332D85C